jgi:hypothetical protein
MEATGGFRQPMRIAEKMEKEPQEAQKGKNWKSQVGGFFISRFGMQKSATCNFQFFPFCASCGSFPFPDFSGTFCAIDRKCRDERRTL